MYIVTELNHYLDNCSTNVQVRYAGEDDITVTFGHVEIYPDVDELKQIVKVLNKAIRDVK